MIPILRGASLSQKYPHGTIKNSKHHSVFQTWCAIVSRSVRSKAGASCATKTTLLLLLLLLLLIRTMGKQKGKDGLPPCSS